LHSFFAPDVDIRTLTIVRDKFNGEIKDYGFVRMTNDEDALTAISVLKGYRIEDRKLEVRVFRDKPLVKKPPFIPPKINSIARADFTLPKKSVRSYLINKVGQSYLLFLNNYFTIRCDLF
jgi:RNA recognition motif-containing protein